MDKQSFFANGQKIEYYPFANVFATEDEINHSCCFFTKREQFNLKYPFSNSELQRIVNTRISYILLSLTEECNMRCDYCAYYDKYDSSFHRKTMTKETAYNSIRYLMLHSSNAKELHISFYGGEPLLRMDLIKYIVILANRMNYLGKRISFSITTNGLLLNHVDTLDYLIENDFYITVSLDGPYVLDRYRKDINHEETYERVITNLRLLLKRDYSYFHTHVSINAVISPPYNMDLYHSFFDRADLSLHRIFVDITDRFKHVLSASGAICDNSLSKYNECDYISTSAPGVSILTSYKPYHRLEANHPDQSVMLGGACYPLCRKSYITADGKILVCEKVNENLDYYCVGSVSDGISYEKLFQLNEMLMNLLNSRCVKCWAARFCSVCYRHLELSEEGMDLFCEHSKKQIEKQIITYYERIHGNLEYEYALDNTTIF